MMTGVLARYFGKRFLGAVLAVFFGVLLLIALIDYVELTRRASELPNVSALLVAKASLFRVPQIAERLMPFCVLVGAMSCYLNLSRRLELVVARAAGVSAWQFVFPAIAIAFLLGVAATAIYNPVSAILQEHSKRIEASMFGESTDQRDVEGSFWIRQRTETNEAILSAKSSREQGRLLNGVVIFVFEPDGQFRERIHARSATMTPGAWQLEDVKIYPPASPPQELARYRLPTNLTETQIRENFATPETVPFWELPQYIGLAEGAGLVAAGYRVQYQKLLSRPFLMVAMVLLAAAVSLRFFRFGGVQKMVLGGVASGFMLYVLSKIIEDMAKAELMPPFAAAWSPALIGSFVGIMALLYQEDG